MKNKTITRSYIVLCYQTTTGLELRREFPTIEAARNCEQYPYNQRRKYYAIEETRTIREIR